MRHTTRYQEERVCKLHKRKTAHVAQVDDVRNDAEHRQAEWKAIDEAKEELEDDDAVDQSRKYPLRENSVLLDELGEVVETRSYERSATASSVEVSGRSGHEPIASVRKQKPTAEPM